ncbi:hypothetical protein [Nonomuraea sp. NPDC046570]|uniref:hypothetical protein n=1 Tax=Nonomuraea sp. NPDC046570 TaxID=3155255 RepID=UPI0033CF594B
MTLHHFDDVEAQAGSVVDDGGLLSAVGPDLGHGRMRGREVVEELFATSRQGRVTSAPGWTVAWIIVIGVCVASEPW